MKRAIGILFAILLLSDLNAQVIRRGKPQSNNTPQQNNSQPQNNGYNDQGEKKEQAPFVFKKRNMVSISVSDIVMTNFTFRYEYFTKKGDIGFQLPISLNAGGVPDTLNYSPNNSGRFLSAKNRIFQTGFNANYYMNGQDKVSPYIGVSLAAGWFKYWINTPITPQPSPPVYPIPYIHEQQIGNNASFAFHAGVLFNPRETLTVNIKGGFGLRRYTTSFSEYTHPFGLVDVSLGFKF